MMKANKSWIKLTIAIVGALFLICISSAQAAMTTNWTETIFTAESQELAFDWDKNSKYDLSFPKPSLKEDHIFQNPDNIVGTIYEFLIPNFYDPLPKKTVEITISGKNGGAAGFELAMVLDVFGVDSPYGVPGPAVPVEGVFVSGTILPTLVTQLWEIFPNPDFEYVKIWVPVEFELESIQIETVSVPLPAAALLLGSGLFGLVIVRRRKR